MFTSLGLFNAIDCPEGKECHLISCIFSHLDSKSKEPQPQTLQSDTLKDATTQQEPVPKRRKFEHNSKTSTIEIQLERKAQRSHDVEPRREVSKLGSVTRKVSPPPAKARQKGEGKEKPTVTATSAGQPSKDGTPSLRRKVPKEPLNPRMLMKAPAPHSVRSSILQKLHAAMSALNEQMVKIKDKDKDKEKSSLVLSADELVVMALDEEHKAAKDNPKVYGNIVKLRIVKLQKMALEDWESEVLAHLNTRYYKIEKPESPQQVKRFTTNMEVDEEITIARMLRTELKGKEQFGYITKAPSPEEIEQAKKGIETAQGWEKCDRCAGRFQVFPGRREDGTLATGGRCTYHPGKIIRPARKATDHITGQADAYFPCCNETVGTSAGCTKAEHHVFKVSEGKRLAAVLQFEETPAQEDKVPRKPVTFDCEMAYTTLGMELVRLTALSWPDGEMLLDVLVKPIGEILDLNSRYSGIFPEHYTNAIPFGTQVLENKAGVEEGEIISPSMQVVDSPARARALLFKYLDPDTPLIGHAIENDLNAARIIHPTVIDTVLLYPHPEHLSKLHLDRDIQMGGDKGHDSKEDALATGDLVRFKVAEKAQVLKRAGWTFQRNP
ncbi:putative RNA exonuclease Rex3 [Talaromyces proteolyticus]|uniref:RNA exonuclease Rex3 n=1 Tax=Talaromyces proteolyticus TaxID=1131652 RepID=A0AAD4KNE8_9EURO|nr:putative RNA exonuclease Rex3 [Talaromyces proteolyticus]KAH8695566.1 putative RNA exonuclease Rex3 [Talaromyces proteolyticus]